MINAKEAHRLSTERWDRNKRDALERELDAIERRVQAAIKRGEWHCETGLTAGTAPVELTDALVALGYTVSVDRRRQTNPVRISWGAPKGMGDG